MAIITPADISSGNPLHRYRTYSYHHALIACLDSTLVDTAFLTATFDQLLPNPGAIGNVTERAKVRFFDNTTKDPFVVLINTMVDSEFLIKSLTYNAVISPAPISTSRDTMGYARTSVFTEGKMIVEEPFGIRFAELLSLASLNLGADTMRTAIVIKSIFVGHTDSTSEIIVNVKPYAVAIWDFTANFSASGGRYELTLMPYTNGLGSRKEFTNVGGIVKGKVVDGTIGGAMQMIETVINADQDKNNKTQPDLDPVHYKIILDDHYKNMKLDVNPGNKDKTGVMLNASINDSLTQIMEKTMMLSSEVRDELTKPAKTDLNTFEDPTLIRNSFRIVSLPKNSQAGFIMQYFIVRTRIFLIPQPTEEEKRTLGKSGLDAKREVALATLENTAREVNNLIIYNYIYTGRNVDILEFNMTMDLSLAFRNYYTEQNDLRASSQLKNKSDPTSSVTGNKPKMDLDTPSKLKVLQSPSLLPREVPYNVSDAAEFQRYNTYLSRFASIVDKEVNLTISGDPRLYSGFLESPVNSDGTLKDQKKQASNPAIVLASWGTMPALVKINVMMPNPPTAILQDQTVQQAFSSPFWYNGLFQVVAIISNFGEDGRFTQQLSLWPIPGQYNMGLNTEYAQTQAATTTNENSTNSDSKAVNAPVLDSKDALNKPPALTQLTDAQKACLAHAYRVAVANNMPPVVLEGIVLADSQACANKDKIINTTSDLVRGATQMTVTRAQNYLRTDPSPLSLPSVRKTGTSITTSNKDSIRALLTLDDDFNLTITAKIWMQDNEFFKRFVGAKSEAIKTLTDRAIVGHGNIIHNQTTDPATDMQAFGVIPTNLETEKDTYLLTVTSYYPTIQEFNSKELPAINIPNSRLRH